MRKLLDLSDSCVKTLSKAAIDKNSKFKNLAENILESEAAEIEKKQNKRNKKKGK